MTHGARLQTFGSLHGLACLDDCFFDEITLTQFGIGSVLLFFYHNAMPDLSSPAICFAGQARE
jgi:hypothetical protein